MLASGEMRAAKGSRPFCADRCIATASCLADFPGPQIICSGRALSSQLVLGSASVCKRIQAIFDAENCQKNSDILESEKYGEEEEKRIKQK